MKRTIVTDKALRELVNEVLDNKDYGIPFVPSAEKTPVAVNAVVDPNATQVDPGDPTFNPQDNRELSLAIDNIVKVVPDESIGPFFKRVKQVADDMLCGREQLATQRPTNNMPVEDDKMNKNEQKKVEEAVRKAVRKILAETMNQDNNEKELGPTGGETTVPAGDAAKPEGSASTPPSAGQQRLKWGQKSSSGYEKKELTPFKDIAAATDMSVAGAKQAVDKAWRKSRFIDNMFKGQKDPQLAQQEWMEDLVSRYVHTLNDSNELSAEDFALLMQHPDMVVELPGFQDFQRAELEDAGYFSDIEFDDQGEPLTRDPGYEFDQKGSLKK